MCEAAGGGGCSAGPFGPGGWSVGRPPGMRSQTGPEPGRDEEAGTVVIRSTRSTSWVKAAVCQCGRGKGE
jgi:hypothetical protein